MSEKTVAPSPPRPGSPTRGYGLALVVIASATLMVTLDATIVNVAIPDIRQNLRFSAASVEWVVAAYSLVFGGLLLLGGRTGDLFGRRRMFMMGIGIFALASLLGGLANNEAWLLAARAVQGAGAAIAAPTALSLIITTFPEGAPRGRAMGVYAAMSGSGGALGMILGGILTDELSWRWVFFVNVPIGALILFLAPKALAGSPGRRSRVDVLGAVMATAAMTALVYGLIEATQDGWGSARTIGSLIGSAVLLTLFILLEARVPAPILPLSIFRNRNRAGAYLITLAVGLGIYGIAFFFMLYMQLILGFSPIEAGFAFLPYVAGIGAAAFIMGRLAPKIGYRPGVTLGPLLAAVGAAWLAFELGGKAGIAPLVVPSLILGLGLGMAVVPLTLTAMSAVQPHEAGIASALISVGQQVGSSVGLAVLGTVAVSDAGSAIAPPGYERSLLVAAGVLAVAFLFAVGVIRGGRRPSAPRVAKSE